MPPKSFNEAMRADREAASGLTRYGEREIERDFGRNIFRQDMGDFGNIAVDEYLSDEVRDRLIAHIRQDVAMNYMAVNNVKKRLRHMQWLLWALILLNVFSLFYR